MLRGVVDGEGGVEDFIARVYHCEEPVLLVPARFVPVMRSHSCFADVVHSHNALDVLSLV